MLLLFHFPDILDRELNLKEFILLPHLPTHKGAIKGPIPLIHILLRCKHHIKILLRLGFIPADSEHNKYIGLHKVLNILNLGHPNRLGLLLLARKLNPKLTGPEHDQCLPEDGYHHLCIVLVYLLLAEGQTDPVPEILPHRVLEDLLELLLVVFVDVVGGLDLLGLLAVDLLEDAVVLLQVDAELGCR